MNRRLAAAGLSGLAAVVLALAAPGWPSLAWLCAGMALGLLLDLYALRPARAGLRAPVRTSADGPARAGAEGLRMLDALRDPVIALTRRANVAFANRAALAAYPALTRDQPLSFALRDPALLAGVQRVLDHGGEARCDLIERVPVERAFACRMTALAAPPARDVKAPVALLMMADISEQRALEAMRVDFVANASHELRTPLASILGFVETLQGAARNDSAARDRFLGIMADQARRMARLVDDLLSLSRIELKEHLAPATTVDLTGVLAETVQALTELARDRGVTLALARPEGDVPVTGARDELMSVFDNLIENAIKYGKSGGRVDVTLDAGASPGEASVVVRDYGPGIAPEHLPRLTERFYRVDNAMSRAEGGTGLGLALVKHTINRHRGRLTIQSAPGQGAVFTVTLPRARSGQTPQREM